MASKHYKELRDGTRETAAAVRGVIQLETRTAHGCRSTIKREFTAEHAKIAEENWLPFFWGRLINVLFCNRWITAVGGMCYSIYLIHYEVISAAGRFTKAVGARLPGPLYLVVQFALVGTAILFICGVYFVLLEKPCMQRDWPQRLWAYVKSIGRGSAAISTDQGEASLPTYSTESAA